MRTKNQVQKPVGPEPKGKVDKFKKVNWEKFLLLIPVLEFIRQVVEMIIQYNK